MKFTKYMFNFPHEATKQILLYNAFSGALALIESEKWETVKYWQLHGIDNSDPDLISDLQRGSFIHADSVDELQELKVVRRKEIAQKIKEAREQGDLSENAEYDAAKDEQRDMEARIEEIEKILKNAVVIDEKFEKGVISLGCHVLLEDITLGKEVTYHIVGSTEADILQNKISNEAPIGRALLGKKIGDVVSVEGINQVNDFRVIDVQRK